MRSVQGPGGFDDPFYDVMTSVQGPEVSTGLGDSTSYSMMA